MRLIVISICIIVWLVVPRAAAEDHQTLQIDKADADLLLVEDGWALWRTSQVIKSTIGNRGVRFNHRIFRHRIDDPIAKQAMEFVAGPGTNPCHSVTADGTLICLNKTGSEVQWYRPDGKIEKSQTLEHTCRIEKAYKDGVLIHWTQTHNVTKFERKQKTWYSFAPFEGYEIDLSKQVQVRSDVGPLVYFRGDEPFRYGDELVWWMKDRLCVVNLKTGVNRDVVDQDHDGREFNLEKTYVSGFDGELVLLGSNVVFDASNGKRVASNWNDKRINCLVMTHNRIGYRIKDGVLEAVELENPDHKPALLAKSVQQPIGRTGKGILVWNGEKWKTIPWFTPRPSDDSGKNEP